MNIFNRITSNLQSFWSNVYDAFHNAEDPTQTLQYKAINNIATPIQSVFSNIQQWGKQLSDIAMQHSANVVDKGYNQGYIDLWSMIKAKHPQYSDIPDEELGRKIVSKYPQYQDIVKKWSGISSNPISWSLATIESGLSKWVWTLFGGISDIWSAPLQDTWTAWVTRFAKWALETGLWAAQTATSIMPTTTWAKALVAPTVNTLFSTDTAGKVIQPVTQWIEKWIWIGQSALGFDPNSSVSKDIQNIGGTVGTTALFAWAQKWASKWYDLAKPLVSKASNTVSNIQNPISWINISKENVPGKTEAGTTFTIDKTPTLWKNITDKLFNKSNEVLAQQSVFPKATKEKTPQMRLESSKTALEWVKQLYEDKANWIVKSDINNMWGGVEWLQEWLDYHGSKIWELTKNNAIIDTSDITPKLAEVISKPFSSLNPEMHSLVTKVVDAFNSAWNKADITTIQWALSNIKSEIFGNWANIAKLYKTESWKALNEFLKSLEDKFNTKIEQTSWNSVELKKAKKAYSNYKKIQKDLTDSYMVELRNQWKWVTGTAWKVAWLYEILSNPSISWILKAVALKQAWETMQYYKTRWWNWETLIRNLDREAKNRNSNPNIK